MNYCQKLKVCNTRVYGRTPSLFVTIKIFIANELCMTAYVTRSREGREGETSVKRERGSVGKKKKTGRKKEGKRQH